MSRAREAFATYAAACPHRMTLPIPRRPANALNIEIGAPHARCRLKTPKHWGDVDYRAVRWLMSGGSPLVLGHCTGNCPLRPNFCACGHRLDLHRLTQPDACAVSSCPCPEWHRDDQSVAPRDGAQKRQD